MDEQLSGGLGNVQVIFEETLNGEQRLVVEGLNGAALENFLQEHFAKRGRQLINQAGNAEVVIADNGLFGVEYLADLNPGDIFGIRQSGDLEFRLADIYTDAVTLKKVSEDVNRLLERDEDLEEDENQELKKRLDRFMEEKYEKLNL